MIKFSSFIPAWWLRNPHLQTIWGSLLRPPPINVRTRRERLELPDNDFLDLDWLEPSDDNPERPIILILHGLAGNIDSHYAKAILKSVQDQGWRAVFMHYRGCSGDHNRTRVSYHSGFTDDVEYVVSVIQQRFPENPLAAVGYSLGGSILLNWLGKTGKKNPLTVAVAISVPFELNKAANRMLNGFSRLYQWHILKSLRQTISDKFESMDGPVDLDHLAEFKTFWEFDTFVTAPLHGFKDAGDYYEKASCRKRLLSVAKPTLIIHAEDDPFMSPEVIPEHHELASETILEISKMGGHVGFISGTMPGSAEYWLESRIIGHLKEFFPQFEKIINDENNDPASEVLQPN
jgi:hypothetical protein